MMAGDPTRVQGQFGGGLGTLSQYITPSLGLNFSESVTGAGFGNDRVTGTPITITFDVPMNVATVSFLYQDPGEDGRGNAYGVLLSAGLVQANFYGPDGALVGHTDGLTPGANGGLLGGAFQGNLPQGTVRVSGPIARMEIVIPKEYGSESWLSGAVAAGVVDYAALQAQAAARDAAMRAANLAVSLAATAGRQAVSDAGAFANAVLMGQRSNWQDTALVASAASAKASFDQSMHDWQTALAAWQQTDQTLLATTAAQDKATIAAAQEFFAKYVTPTIPATVSTLVPTYAALTPSLLPTTPPPVSSPTPLTDFVGQAPTANMQMAPDTYGTSPTIESGLVPDTPLISGVGGTWQPAPSPQITLTPDLPPVVQGGPPGAPVTPGLSGVAILAGVGLVAFLMARKGH